MNIQVTNRPAYALAQVTLAPGESVQAESGAMVAMHGDVNIQTKAAGGVLKSLARKALTGESFFQNTFTAGPKGGDVLLAPSYPGDITELDLAGQALIVQDGSYLGGSPTLQVSTSWQGAKGFFAGESFVLLRVQGQGKLLLASYGAIEKRTLAPGEKFVVDTGHVVAFTEGTPYQTRRVGGMKSTLFSGEGVVSEFSGPGTLWLQSRSVQAFIAFLSPYIAQRNQG